MRSRVLLANVRIQWLFFCSEMFVQRIGIPIGY